MVVDTQPGVTVTQVPECHTVDDILMLAQHLEDAVILVSEHGVQIAGQRTILTTRELQLSAHFLIDANVEFRNMDVLHKL